MSFTIAQIAEANNVSKSYVRKLLKDNDLLADHTTTEGGRGTILVDDEATQIVSDLVAKGVRARGDQQRDLDSLLSEDRRPSPEPEPVPREKTQSELYEEQISYLKAQIELLRSDVRDANDRAAEQQAAFVERIKALPSADEVKDAREEGEARGREAEREKIASMGFFARMRYLRG